MDLKGTQLQQTFGNLVTVGTSAGTPTLGQIENGNGDPLTQITLGLGSVGAPSYSFTGDTDTGIFSSGANVLNLATGGNNRMTIASGGNISIGTANSSAKLQVGTSSEEILRLERDTTSNDSFIDLTYASGHSNDSDANHEYAKIRTKVVANLSGQESGELYFQTINAGTIGDKMVISKEGNVGIGTASPASISSTARWLTLDADNGSSASGGIIHQINGTTKGALYVFGSNVYHDAKAGIGHIFAVNNGTESMRIDSSGNVGIGTSSPVNNTPLTLQAPSGYTDTLWLKSVGTNISSRINIAPTGTGNAQINNATGTNIEFQVSGSEKMRIDSSGNITHSGTSPQYIFKTASNTNFQIAIQENVANALEITPSTTAGGTTFSNPALVVNSSGNVGIGTSSPTTRLDVAGSSGGGSIKISGDMSAGANYYGFIFDGSSLQGTTQTNIFYAGGAVKADTTITDFASLRIDAPSTAASNAVITNNYGIYQASTAQKNFFNGNVGIGTASPSQKLSVTGNIGTSGSVLFDDNQGIKFGNVNAQITGSTANGLMFFAGGSEKMRFDTSGRLGIGADSLTDLLHLKKAGGAQIRFENPTTTRHIRIGEGVGVPDVLSFRGSGVGTDSLSIDFANNRVGIRQISPDANLQIMNNDSSSYRFGYGGTSDVYLDTDNIYFRSDNGGTNYAILKSGNLGIGTLSPDEPVHVAKSTGDAIIAVEANDGNAALYLTSAGTNKDNRIVSGNAKDLKFEAQPAGSGQGQGQDPTATGTTVMTLKNDGTLLVGTTSDDFSSAGHTFFANGASYQVRDGGTLKAYKRLNSDGEVVAFRRDSTQVGNISVTSSATAYNTSSDYRLKENVIEMTGALDRVDQLKPSRFNFIIDGDTTVDGFLAHEVADVVPEAITGEKDAVDEEGNPMYQGIDQSKLVPLLVGAIQELRAEIEQLKNQ